MPPTALTPHYGSQIPPAEAISTHLPKCGHGDNGIPEGSWNASEFTGAGSFFCIKHDRGEDDDGHGKREEEKAELRGTAL